MNSVKEAIVKNGKYYFKGMKKNKSAIPNCVNCKKQIPYTGIELNSEHMCIPCLYVCSNYILYGSVHGPGKTSQEKDEHSDFKPLIQEQTLASQTRLPPKEYRHASPKRSDRLCERTFSNFHPGFVKY
jgi:hypothetical protein